MLSIIDDYIKAGSQVSKLGNISSICMEFIEDLNWVGFYLYDEKEDLLILDAFSGKRAVAIIEPTEGVCGHCFTTREIQNIADVHSFEGHIACDLNSKSELVLPIIKDNKIIGVFDIDSPKLNRFDTDTIDTFKKVLDKVILCLN